MKQGHPSYHFIHACRHAGSKWIQLRWILLRSLS